MELPLGGTKKMMEMRRDLKENEREVMGRPGVFVWDGTMVPSKNKFGMDIMIADIPEKKLGESEFIDTVIVVSNYIPENAFYRNKRIKFVYGPNVENIGNQAFVGCTSLTSVDMPLVKTIGDRVFLECKNLKNVTIPDVETIGENVFYGCYSLTTIGYYVWR